MHRTRTRVSCGPGGARAAVETHPFGRLEEVLEERGAREFRVPCDPFEKALQAARARGVSSSSAALAGGGTHSIRLRSMNSALKRSPVRYSVQRSGSADTCAAWRGDGPMRCLSGSGGTTAAGKSLVRCSRRKVKSWNRRREVGSLDAKCFRSVCVQVVSCCDLWPCREAMTR